MRGVRWLGFAWVAALALACAAPTPEQQMAAWRERAVSPERWEQVRLYLEGLTPGDDLDVFGGAREVHVREQTRQPPVVVIPGWISSLSGGAAGGLSMFGQFIGRTGERVHGSHVFGTVEEDRILPRHQVFTEATLVSRAEYEQLAKLGEEHIGAIPRPNGTLFFRDLFVVGQRPLPPPEPDADPENLYSQDGYAEVRSILAGLPEGTDLLSLLAALGARYRTDDFGETHHLRVRGFLHAGTARTRTLESSEGVFKLRPFGWVDGEREVVEQIAIFENDRLVRVVDHRDDDDWTSYLSAVRSR